MSINVSADAIPTMHHGVSFQEIESMRSARCYSVFVLRCNASLFLLSQTRPSLSSSLLRPHLVLHRPPFHLAKQPRIAPIHTPLTFVFACRAELFCLCCELRYVTGEPVCCDLVVGEG